MSLKKKILIILVVGVAIGATFMFAAFKKIYTPTTGAKIAHYADPEKALLVIDVQEDYTGLKGKQPVPYPDAATQITVINKLIDKASATGLHVVISGNFSITTLSRGISSAGPLRGSRARSLMHGSA